MSIQSQNDRRHTAVHEAGHAVIGRVLTLACGGVTIEPDQVEMTAGWSETPDPYQCLAEWEQRGHVREAENAVWHARIISYMAGAEAEILILGSTQGGDGDDRYQIEMMAESQLGLQPEAWERREARLRAFTRALLRRHRERVERVANALLDEGSLSSEQVDELTGRSIADVRVNAPFLRERHRQRADDMSES